jgi:hypothetical protein
MNPRRHVLKTGAALAAIVLLLILSSCSDTSSSEYKAGEKTRQTFIDRAKSLVHKKHTEKIDEDFFTDYGAWDFYRFPLAYPYQITMIDGTRDGGITTYNPEENVYFHIVTGITQCAFDARFLVGKNDDGWFVFEFENKKTQPFDSKEEAITEAVKQGFDSKLEVMSIDEQYRSFSHDR